MARGHRGHGTHWRRVVHAIEYDKLTQRGAYRSRSIDKGSEIPEHPHMQHARRIANVNSDGTIRSGLHPTLQPRYIYNILYLVAAKLKYSVHTYLNTYLCHRWILVGLTLLKLNEFQSPFLFLSV